ncbi:SIR2 family protein [Achromobacter aegrifaciens]|uniref:SIR2 family protein n=1 Tax=Achromobacter aegrifaciens TaxID=1287736 RepID=UPI0015838BD6|nr:SIR2 family protein [Achromobacter aegrifaciens]
MSFDDFPKVFDPSRCVIFLGAGFSADSKNKNNGYPPVGNGLNKAIKILANIPVDEPSDFTDSAGYAISQKLDLFGLLEGLYTIKQLTDSQRSILSLPWLRIYTTNYDNSVSVFRAENNRNANGDIFDLTDEPPRQLRKGAVVHLHGSIAKCQPNNLDQSLVLTRRSYVEQRVKKSRWWDWFDRDIKISQYVFFLGYDINDFEPASYLIKYPGMEGRRHFILRNPKSPIMASKLADYGVRHSFEMTGFVDRLNRAKVEATPAHERELSSFRYVDLSKDNKLPLKPTSAEIQELLAFGRTRFDAMRSTLPESEYVVFRKNLLDTCRDALKESKTLVIHSKIGNGKTIVSDELKVVLSQEGRRCFILRDSISPLPQDIEFLKGIDAPVIFFPNYDSAIANIHLFDGLTENARYVVEISSSTLQVRMQEVHNRLRGKIARVGIDRLDHEDATALRNLLGKAGLTALARVADIREGIEFRDFLLMSYDDPEIAKRLRSVINPLLQNASARRLICISSILKSAGLPVDVGFIENVIGEDPYAILSGLGESVLELMEYSMDKLAPYSSVLSEHILRKYIDPKDFVGIIFDLAAEAARRIDEECDFSSERFRRARGLLSAVIRFGFINSIIGHTPDKRKTIGKLYESCRRDALIEKEPLFWLQYSIFWQDEPRWDLAESHMAEAYARGATRPGFKTFQLDTNFLGLLCDLELFFSSVGQPVTRFEKLTELMETCRAMIDDGNHRNHVIKAFLKLEPMISKRNGDFTDAQCAALCYGLSLVVEKLVALPASEKALWGTEPCRISLGNCIRILKRQ